MFRHPRSASIADLSRIELQSVGSHLHPVGTSDVPVEAPRVLWTHTFPPEVALGGTFMHLLARECPAAGVVPSLRFIGGWSRLIGLPATILGLFREAAEYDVVHAQFGSGCGLVTSILPAAKAVTLRGSDWYGSQGTGVLGKSHSFLARWMTRISLHRYALVIVVSERMKAELRQAGFAGQVEVLPDGVDLSVFKPMDRAEARAKLFASGDTSPWILFSSTAQARPEKRFHLAQETVEIVQKTIPDAKLVLASGVPQAEMVKYINACDLVLLTSTHEGWPNIVKEALACNVPFVSTDVSDLARLADLSPHCHVSPPKPEELAERVISTLEARPARPDLRALVECMDVRTTAKTLAGFYESLRERTARVRSASGPASYSQTYVLTFLTEIAGILVSLWVFRLVLQELGESGLSEFTLARRSLGLVVPTLALGLGVSLTRYVAMAQEGVEGRSPHGYLVAGVLIISACVGLFLSFLIVAPELLAFAFFGSPDFQFLVPSLALWAVGQMFYGVVYAYYRGRMEMGRANALELANGLMPLIAILFWGTSVQSVILVTGVLTCLLVAGSLGKVLVSEGPPTGRIGRHSRELLTYGVRRVPGDFAFTALFTLPAVLVAHSVGVAEGGLVGFAIGMVTMMGTPFSPLSKTILPIASRLLQSGDVATLGTVVIRTLWLSSTAVIAATVVAEAILPVAMRIYLGEVPVGLIPIMRVLILAAPAYCVFVSFRSVIDAAHETAINARHCYVALTIFSAIAAVGELAFGGVLPTLAAFLVAMYALAGLTVMRILRLPGRTVGVPA